MDLERLRASPVGHLVPVRVRDGDTVYDHEAFIPADLPNSLNMSPRAWNAVIEASGALARLDGAAWRLPNPYLLVRPALTKEAVSSSALEGTYAAVEDVLQAEYLPEGDLTSETAEVRNYVLAAELGLELIKELPICLRLVRQVHGQLMVGARGESVEAGEFRQRQNWIGPRRGSPITDALFVPPPPGGPLDRALNSWEAWVNRNNELPVLTKVALGHYQFETIHPFVDGNGRVGRLITTLAFMASNQLRIPLLNISPYFEENRDAYVDGLRDVSASGDFEPWIVFFAEAVRVQSERALEKADRLMTARDEIVSTLHDAGMRGVGIRIAEDLIATPVLSPTRTAEKYNVSFQTANNAIMRLVEHDFLREMTGRTYGRLFMSPQIVAVIAT